jgi:hypothetical protein
MANFDVIIGPHPSSVKLPGWLIVVGPENVTVVSRLIFEPINGEAAAVFLVACLPKPRHGS